MPIPKPKKNQTHKAFMIECMGDPIMNKEFPNQSQRSAVCEASWKNDQAIGDEIGKEDKQIKKAKNAVINALSSNKISRPEKCQKCSVVGSVEAHHHKGYDDDHLLDVKWLCRACHVEAHKRIKAKDVSSNIEHDVQHVDFVEFNLPGEGNIEFLTDKFERTPEGYLQGQSIITNIGVFPYLNGDGTIRYELRPPEEVLKMESLKTLQMKPFTNNHPQINDGYVDSKNIKEVQVGQLGDDVRYDAFHVSLPITITDEQTIKDAENGKRALSAAYLCDKEERSGVWLGMKYDYIQRNIRYNHVSLVDRGRAGDAARLRMDSVDGSFAMSKDIQLIHREDDMNLKSVQIDGVTYQSEGEVIKAYNLQKDKVAELEIKIKSFETDATKSQKTIDTLTAERDTLKDKVSQLEKDKEASVDQSVIDEAVKRRLDMLQIAELADVELKGDEQDTDIQKAVILKVFPEAELKDKSQDYLDARFDGAIEILKQQKEKQEEDEEANNDAANRQIGGALPSKEKKEPTATSARQAMIDRLKKDSRSFEHEEVA